MNPNAEILFMLCSHLIADDSCKPFEPSEWSRLAEKLLQAGLQPKELPDLTDADYRDLEIESSEEQRIRQLQGQQQVGQRSRKLQRPGRI